jgi:hypothetical protein
VTARKVRLSLADPRVRLRACSLVQEALRDQATEDAILTLCLAAASVLGDARQSIGSRFECLSAAELNALLLELVQRASVTE